MRAPLLAIVALVTLAPGPRPAYALGVLAPPGAPGRVRFVKVANSAFDRFTANPTPDAQHWMQNHYWRMVAYSPYFDGRLAWFADAWVYRDLYAIHTDGALATTHPEWILRDASGAKLYIPYDCANGTCPQYAADVGNPDFRAWWIADAKSALRAGYAGLWVDDVNMLVSRVADGTRQPVPPIDPRTGVAMPEADWRRYVAEFCEQIRAAVPEVEVIHNVVWYAPRDDPFVVRELQSASFVNLERGVNDTGIRGGGGTYGYDTFLGLVDWLHARGKAVVFDASAKTDADREYGLASYFLVNATRDGLGNDPGGTPDDWWAGYDADLGEPRGPRYAWRAVVRRDFAKGLVLVNEPGAPSQTLDLGATWANLRGESVTAVTLGPASGAVLVKPAAP